MPKSTDAQALKWVEPDEPLPPATQALTDPNGLLAAGRDLSPKRLIEAYRAGVFPWFAAGQPVLWWSPDPRMVLPVAEFKISRSLVKTLRRVRREGYWRVTLNQDFAAVMSACAQPRPGQDGTWITAEVRAAYGGLHRMGLAHSVEVWDGMALIGGVYGVALGRMFFGESMFARRTDASKCALAALVALLRQQRFAWIDCQQATSHLATLGARTMPRAEFLHRVAENVALLPPAWPALCVDFPDV
jgi:leucyl/phenylalanyl-tRNA--protein transferase